ncbi:RNA polymerase sigma factor [Paludisphaera soli]|uniref:RNA polymerase sigma factor n=1 Tax=Paludisphaera soli TaxID=2712865 RepID=UPI0013EAF4D9|nr:sigma-70 family RNA polymerase sigma factor [Paludisphaera soli]
MTRAKTPSAELRSLLAHGTATGATDHQLLERFRSAEGPSDAGAEAAFAALVDRHAALVWGVCRRGLPDRADAEDAFQATFLVLVRKAASVRADARGSLGPWLYGVARRVAARIRRQARNLPPPIGEPSDADDPAIAAERREACAAVSAELDRLPAKYRRPIELCDYEGLTYEQAAHSLGWPTATLKSRLARGRQRLKGRLARRGLAPLAGIVMAELSRECRAGVSQAVLSSTSRVATAASGLVPAAVARLAEGAMTAMLWNKLKPFALVLLGVFGAATLGAPFRTRAPSDDPPAVSRAQAPEAARAGAEPDPRWSRRLADGTVVEILGLSTYPASPTSWWRPDGSPLKPAPCDAITRLDAQDPLMNPGGQFTARQVVMRITSRPGNRLLKTDFAPSAGFSTIDAATREGEPAPALRSGFWQFPKSLATTSLQIEAASLPWQTFHTLGMGAGSFQCRTWNSSVVETLSGGAVATSRGTSLSVVRGFYLDDGRPFRIIAVDRDGREHTDDAPRVVHNLNAELTTAEFAVVPDRVREFRLQEVPFESLTIPDVALHPRKIEDPR